MMAYHLRYLQKKYWKTKYSVNFPVCVRQKTVVCGGSENRKHFYDYVFMSPIYDSISKVNYYSTYTAEELREAQKLKSLTRK